MNCNNSSQNLYFLRSKCISKLKFPITNMGLKSSPHWHIKWRVQAGHTQKKIVLSFSLIKFKELTNLIFLLTISDIMKRKGYKVKSIDRNNHLPKEKCFLSISTNSSRKCVEISLEKLYVDVYWGSKGYLMTFSSFFNFYLQK